MILADQGVERERIAAFQEKCGEEFGENAVLNRKISSTRASSR